MEGSISSSAATYRSFVVLADGCCSFWKFALRVCRSILTIRSQRFGLLDCFSDEFPSTRRSKLEQSVTILLLLADCKKLLEQLLVSNALHWSQAGRDCYGRFVYQWYNTPRLLHSPPQPKEYRARCNASVGETISVMKWWCASCASGFALASINGCHYRAAELSII